MYANRFYDIREVSTETDVKIRENERNLEGLILDAEFQVKKYNNYMF